jgi:hypothetical protein
MVLPERCGFAMADALRGTRLAVVAVADNAWQPAELVELAVIHLDDGAVVRGPLVWTVRPEHLPAPQTAHRFGVPYGRVAQGPTGPTSPNTSPRY